MTGTAAWFAWFVYRCEACRITTYVRADPPPEYADCTPSPLCCDNATLIDVTDAIVTIPERWCSSRWPRIIPLPDIR